MDYKDDTVQVWHGRDWSTPREDARPIEFVAIDGICNDPQGPWGDGTHCWLRDMLLIDHPTSRVSVIDLKLSELNSWNSFLNCGEQLCYILKRLQLRVETLRILASDAWKDHRPKLSAIVFFGTPFGPRNSDKDYREILRRCISVESGIDKKPRLDITEEDAARIKSFVLEHRNLLKGIRSISCFERNESLCNWKFLNHRIQIPRQQMVVSADTALWGKSTEVLFGIGSGHRDIGRLSRNDYAGLKARLEELMSRLQGPEGSTAPATNVVRRSSEHIDATPSATALGPVGNEKRPEPSLPPSFGPEPTMTKLPSQQVPVLSNTSPISRCHALGYHQHNPYFIGRSETLARIKDHLRPFLANYQGPEPRRAYSLWGKGGVGKTQIAVQYVLDSLHEFPYVLWARADTREKLLASFSKYALNLGLITEEGRDPRHGCEALLQWYSTTESPWLLVFDNADDISVLTEFWRHGSRGSILVTSRDHASATSTLACQGEQISEFEEDVAVRLLESLLGREFKNPDERLCAKIIANRVQRLPLAIKSVAGTIIATKCSLEDFSNGWEKLQKIIDDSDIHHIDSPTSRYDHSLKTVWASSVRALGAESRSLLEALSVFDPDGVPEDLFKSFKGLETDRFPFLGRNQFLKSCLGLHRTSLIQSIEKPIREFLPTPAFSSFQPAQTSERDNNQLVIHRLIRTYVDSQMDVVSRRQAFSAALIVLNSAWPYPAPHNRTQGAFWIDQEKYLPHVQSVGVFHKAYQAINPNSEPVECMTLVKLLNSAAWYCYTRGMYNEAYPLIDTARGCISLAPGNDMDWKMIALHTNHVSGSIATETGEFEKSLEEFTGSLAYVRELIDAELIHRPDVREAQAIGGIANSFSGLGKHLQAEKYYRESISLWKADTYPVYRILLGRPLLAQNKLQEASDWLEMVLREREEKYEKDSTIDYKTGQAYYILGDVRIAQHRYDEAYECHRKALRLLTSTLGIRHRITGDASYKVGWHALRLGQLDMAKTALQEALAMYGSISDQKSVWGVQARTWYKLGAVFEKQSGTDTQVILECRGKADTLRQRIMGDSYTPGSGEESYNAIVSLWSL
ncbi:hypothetical protein GGR54DRAFT_641435 [Hypoxylon sp. NC1633]|nr:hypothetical protein GGR54DRAFT_641435 [Hypoxylon sp. NC1633]